MRTIDDIVPPSRRREAGQTANGPAGRKPRSDHGPASHFPYKTIGAVVLVIIVSIVALYYFSSAQVEVTPNTVSAAVQNSFTATKSTGDLPFEIVSAQKIASQTVKGSGTKTVNTAASGDLTIYNTQSKTQRLINNTRFETTSGLIFRIHQAVTVPSGSASKPGSLTVRVYADKTGGAYNVGPTSFTIPGLAGTSIASKVYARSTSAMTGGASGTEPVVDPTTEAQAKQQLTAALGPDLQASLESQMPTGYVLVPGAATTTFQALAPSPSSTTGMVDVKEQGTITAVVFPNAALAKAIAGSIAGLGYQGSPISLPSTKGLSLTAASFPTPDSSSFSFSLNGTVSLTYTIDPTQIAAAVAGKTRSAAEVALTNYPQVKRAVIILRPFWRQTFPADPSSIQVTIANP